MNIAILGFGLEGQAAYEYWRADNDITICDRDSDLTTPSGAQTQLGADYLAHLDNFDLVVRSPQVHPSAIAAANGVDIAHKTTSNVNEFMRVCPSRNIFGVTGTKGKGTTSTLVAKMLEAAGKKVHLGGNIGVAALNMLANGIQPDDYVVLELSNFQLIDVQHSPHIAVCLMVVPEHLDWHKDAAEYFAAKQQLFKHQTESDIAIYYPANNNSVAIAGVSSGVKLPYFEQPGAYISDGKIIIDDTVITDVNQVKLLGDHNLQNVCASVTAVWQITQDVSALQSVITTFAGLPFRLELVHELNGVGYYNDSFGTTPETAIVAMQAFSSPKVIILGGSDKGASYDQLAQIVATANVRHVVLIGNQTPALRVALDAVGYTDYTSGGTTMQAIVQEAHNNAHPGDVVLLSTACASFDMFKSYKDRGAQFTAAVQALG